MFETVAEIYRAYAAGMIHAGAKYAEGGSSGEEEEEGRW